jgi:putative lipoic acid-binding regulatory protein
MKIEGKIEYPLEWQFVVIGKNQSDIQNAVIKVMEAQQYKLELKNTSKKGAYISMQLRCMVYSENHRNALFQQLSDEEDVSFVI